MSFLNAEIKADTAETKAAKVRAVFAYPPKRLPVVKKTAVKTRLIKVDFFMVLHYTKGKVGY